MSSQPNPTLTVEILNVAHGGVMVARHEGRVIFVPDVIPGEVVEVAVTDSSKPSFWRAEALGVVEASPHRRPHVWPEADISRAPVQRAGGAEFGHIDLSFQRELKSKVLNEALKKFSGIDSKTSVRPVQNDSGLHWRTRIKLHVNDDGMIGPFAARSHQVVPVKSLPLATKNISDLIDFDSKFAPGVVELADSFSEGAFVINDRTRSIVERAAGYDFQLSAGGFWQVHKDAANTLVSTVLSQLTEVSFDPEAENLDLYGGVGLFAVGLAKNFGPQTRITSVENDGEASRYAEKNLRDFRSSRVRAERVDRFLTSISKNGTTLSGATVVLDPPRKGAGKEVIENLANLEVANLVYVACDPVAFARDLAILLSNGYEVVRLEGLDIFPNTHHFETVATLTRSRR